MLSDLGQSEQWKSVSSTTRAALWRDVHKRAKRRAVIQISLAGLAVEAIAFVLYGLWRGWSQAVDDVLIPLVCLTVAGAFVAVVTYAIQLRGVIEGVYADQIWSINKQHEELTRLRGAAEEASRAREQYDTQAKEIATLRATLDKTGQYKELRIDTDGIIFVEEEAQRGGSVYALVWGVNVTNPNDFVVDVESGLYLEFGGMRHGSQATSWPPEHLKTPTPMTEKGKAVLGQFLGKAFEVDAHRTKHGHLLFHVNPLMMQLINRFAPQDVLRFWLSVRDKNYGVNGESLLIAQRLAHPVLMPPESNDQSPKK